VHRSESGPERHAAQVVDEAESRLILNPLINSVTSSGNAEALALIASSTGLMACPDVDEQEEWIPIASALRNAW
jgi:hypothetical protein